MFLSSIFMHFSIKASKYLPINYESEYFSTMFKFLFISSGDQTCTYGYDVNGSNIKDIRERRWKNEEHSATRIEYPLNKQNSFKGRLNI